MSMIDAMLETRDALEDRLKIYKENYNIETDIVRRIMLSENAIHCIEAIAWIQNEINNEIEMER